MGKMGKMGRAVNNARIGAQTGREMASGGVRGKVTNKIVSSSIKRTGGVKKNKAFVAGTKIGRVKGPVKKKK